MKILFTSIRLLVALLTGVLFVTPVLSQPGSNDPTFNSTDQGFGFGDGASSSVRTTAIQTDGKIIIAGDFPSYNGTLRNRLARLNSDGSLDTGFNPGTGANDVISTAAIQSDGKIIIGGNFTSYNGTGRNGLARLNTDGSLDAGFNPGTGIPLYNSVLATAIQSDGKIIIAGTFTSYNGTARNNIARLNTDGSLDAGFNPGTGANSVIYTTAIQSDGKIIIGGFFTSYNGTTRNRLARVNTDGSLDIGFNPGTGANDAIRTSAIQGDGKIIIGGSFTSYNGVGRNSIARVNTDGSLDIGFTPGTGANNGIYSTAIQTDGKIIIAGYFTSYNGVGRNSIARVNTDGSLDAGFNPGTGADYDIQTTAILSDGKIIIGGQFTFYNATPRNRITRLNSDGSIDGGFNPGTGANNGTGINNGIETTAIQSDGKIIIGGNFTSYNGTPRKNLARLNADGGLDAGFNPGTGANSTITSTAIQSDGKIIIGGSFNSYNGTARNSIARLNTNGSLDAGFTSILTGNDIAITTAIQPDGKIIIAGNSFGFNGILRKKIVRLNNNGNLDGGFNPSSGASDVIVTTAIQGDGKIIIGGSFTSYDGTLRNSIARLNSDGSLDAGFIPGTGPTSGIVRTIAIQSDGKIIIGGDFSGYNGTTIKGIARLNTDGSLDAGFNSGGTGANSNISTTAIQNDGKIIISGPFTSYNGTARNSIARLNTNGSLDAGFNPGTGATSGFIRTTTIQSDGNIIIGGSFTGYNGTGRNRVARVIGGGAPASSSPSDYFRTITSGNWNTPATWESSPVADFSSGVISPATLAPDLNAKTITIRSSHTLIVTEDVIADQITVAPGGDLRVKSGVTLTVK